MISQILAAVLNFSDLNDHFCLACDEAGMVKILIKISQELQDSVSHHVKYMVGKQYYYTGHFEHFIIRLRLCNVSQGLTMASVCPRQVH